MSQKVRGGIAAFPVAMLVLAAACLVSASAWGGVGQMLTVQVREAQMRSAPSFTGRLAATLAYGQKVSVLEEQGAWTKARSANSEGWVHTSALTDRRLDLASGGRDVASGTDSREVAAAGKGFTAETERAYRQDHPDGYAQVEAMLRFRHSPAGLLAFLAAGPWPREVCSVILDFCRRAGAATVSFDVLFSEPSLYGVEDDKTLADSGVSYGRLVLAFALGSGTGSAAWPEAGGISADARIVWHVPPHLFPNATRASFPTPDVRTGAAALGTVNQLPDPDGVFRAVHPLSFFAGRPVPSLFLAAYAVHNPGTTVRHEAAVLSVQPPNRPAAVIPLDGEGRAILNFRGRAGTRPAYSAAAVIQSELRIREEQEAVISPEFLRGKHVFLGFTAPALLDLRPSPTDGAFSGVELHATALDNLLADDFFRPLPGWISIPLSAALCLATAFLALRAAHLRQLGLVACIALPIPALCAWGAYRALYWLPFVNLFLAVFLALSFSVALAYATEGRQRRFLKNAFSQYLSPEVTNQIIKYPDMLKLGGERREISIYFSDLAGFSAISESLSPEALTQLLNEYLSAMTDIILEEGGIIDKYEGDAIIVFWNAPYPQEDHAPRALRAAMRCQERLTAMQPRFQELAGRELAMRIGLNTGAAVVGNMGSRSRCDYTTMLGDAVNLASRLEGANKEFGTRTQVSRDAFAAAGSAFAGRDLGAFAGRRPQGGPPRCWNPCGMRKPLPGAICCIGSLRGWPRFRPDAWARRRNASPASRHPTRRQRRI